ncbi:Sigma54-dependent transcription regulator containing an AAA-type ATPase domain and a DNA-binding domain [Proteus vulgaris]|nr:Sigma54-dependent transcription regulator containing an AAA-type ATPase domain and a DNA-binding domain [Proteus vulgaris]
MKRKVVIGVLGTTLDKRGKSHKRWNSWRQQFPFVIKRISLLAD